MTFIPTKLVSKQLNSMHFYTNACKKWNAELKGFSRTNNASSAKTLEAVYPQLKNSGIFLTTYGKLLNLSNQYNRAIAALRRANCFLPSATNYTELGKSYKATGDFENAENVWTKASYMIPSMFTPKYLLAKMLYETGKTTDSQKIASELLQKQIKIENPDLPDMLKEMTSIVETRINRINNFQ